MAEGKKRVWYQECLVFRETLACGLRACILSEVHDREIETATVNLTEILDQSLRSRLAE